MEIKNIVFDMGNVLLDFSFDRVLDLYFSDPRDRALIRERIFDSGEWDRLDAGEFTEEEAITHWLTLLPESLREGMEAIFAHWHETLTPIDGMAELVRDLKDNGYRCYLLSNTSVRVDSYADRYESMRLLDGRFVSAHYKLMKPDVVIYQTMCRVFSLTPAECVFIDDRRDNVEGAILAGMRGVQFPTYDAAALREALRREGVRV